MIELLVIYIYCMCTTYVYMKTRWLNYETLNLYIIKSFHCLIMDLHKIHESVFKKHVGNGIKHKKGTWAKQIPENIFAFSSPVMMHTKFLFIYL